VIEKHFTIDRSLPGPDHQASLEPGELAAMVRCIRNVELALGSGIKRPTDSEERNRTVARKSIVASRAIAAGEVLCESNLTVKRPAIGLSPMRWDEILGRRAGRAYAADEPIEL
jgi:sialic acid synthase SpsE